jgi:hypothetical protein
MFGPRTAETAGMRAVSSDRRSASSRKSSRRSQCKWGRPEGRPHSHQCVVPVRDTWHPVSLPSGCNLAIASSGLCHRCSHRHPVPSDGGCRIRRSLPGPPGGSETGFPLLVSHLERLRFPAEAFLRLLGERPGQPADDGNAFAFFSNDPPCAGPKSFAGLVSKTARTVAAISIGFGKLRTFKSLNLSAEMLSASSRWLEAAPRG